MHAYATAHMHTLDGLFLTSLTTHAVTQPSAVIRGNITLHNMTRARDLFMGGQHNTFPLLRYEHQKNRDLVLAKSTQVSECLGHHLEISAAHHVVRKETAASACLP